MSKTSALVDHTPREPDGHRLLQLEAFELFGHLVRLFLRVIMLVFGYGHVCLCFLCVWLHVVMIVVIYQVNPFLFPTRLCLVLTG